jgi:hypothetical protein
MKIATFKALDTEDCLRDEVDNQSSKLLSGHADDNPPVWKDETRMLADAKQEEFCPFRVSDFRIETSYFKFGSSTQWNSSHPQPYAVKYDLPQQELRVAGRSSPELVMI